LCICIFSSRKIEGQNSSNKQTKKIIGKKPSIMLLSEEQVRFFHENGYLVIENVLNIDEMKELKDRMSDIIERDFDIEKHNTIFTCSAENASHIRNVYFLESADRISFFLEKEKPSDLSLGENGKFILNKVGHALADKDEIFKKYTFTKQVHDITKQLMQYKDVTVVQSMTIFKPPHIGGEVVPHRDSTFIITKTIPCIGWWIPLEDATKENGCLWGVPGSHKRGLAKEWIRSSRNNHENEMRFHYIIEEEKQIQEYEQMDREAQFIPLEMKAGSAILLHGHFLHKSEKNLSDKSREAYTFHLVDRADYDYEKNWLLRDKFPSFWPED
jgi:phytanoyl-CoA hydroxylase